MKHQWSIVETEKGYDVLLDRGYGYMAVLKGAECLGIGITEVVGGINFPFVALDRHYYGLPKFLWF